MEIIETARAPSLFSGSCAAELLPTIHLIPPRLSYVSCHSTIVFGEWLAVGDSSFRKLSVASVSAQRRWKASEKRLPAYCLGWVGFPAR